MKGQRNIVPIVVGRFAHVAALLLVGIGQVQAAAPDVASQEMFEKILAGVQTPSMRQRWLDAYENGELPALDDIPLPEQSFVKRKPNRMMVDALPPRRPVINPNTIDVQPFSPTARHAYEGGFTVLTHDSGVINGKLDGQEEPFEILYKLPDGRELRRLRADMTYQLVYEDNVEKSAQQRRILLSDRETNALILASIAEGSQDPYETTIDNLNLTIKQDEEGASPAVEVIYRDQAVTLRQGQQKVIGTGVNAVHVYLLTSYHDMSPSGSLTEGQPYYLRIVLYR